jgi:hypothetical protein
LFATSDSVENALCLILPAYHARSGGADRQPRSLQVDGDRFSEIKQSTPVTYENATHWIYSLPENGAGNRMALQAAASLRNPL